MNTPPNLLLHASCVAIKGRGVLIVGPSGIGKSDLALQLIDSGALLVSDDQTRITSDHRTGVWAEAPSTIEGLIEARHVGLLKLPYLKRAPVALYVELTDDPASLDRLPEPSFYSLLDKPVLWLKLPSKQASTPAKIRFVLQGARDDTV